MMIEEIERKYLKCDSIYIMYIKMVVTIKELCDVEG